VSRDRARIVRQVAALLYVATVLGFGMIAATEILLW
jgi:hypothetical protein